MKHNQYLLEKYIGYEYIKDFVKKYDMRHQLYMTWLHALWVVYCEDYNMEVNTYAYDTRIYELYNILEQSHHIHISFDDFDMLMCKGLV